MREHRIGLGEGGSKLMAKAPSLLPRGLARVFALALLGVILSLGVAVPKAAANPLDSIGAAVMQLLGIGDAEPAAAFDETAVADPNTMTTWQGIVEKSTENIGRIWTDKTVSSDDVTLSVSPDGAASEVEIGDSDFLVALSALSSTSNTTTTSSKPLDIVLVLDMSGSMGEELSSGYVYSETYDIRTDGRTTYYALNGDGTYAEIERVAGWFGVSGHWELNGKEVSAKESADDTTEGRIQFYTRSRKTVSRLEALKTAANSFIETTANQNDDIKDESKQHRVSVVKFAGDESSSVGNDTYLDWYKGNRVEYNYSQIVTQLAAYNSANVTTGTDAVNNLKAVGSTRADLGMSRAQAALSGARTDAQKVVIFFTDGMPTDGSEWNSSVANAAVTNAKAMKGSGALVYTIGVFAGADPSNPATSPSNQFNAYMHGVSSNFPGATAWNMLGDRAKDSNYYKAATDADELNKIFQEISEEINKGTGLPTETTDGFENHSGFITFTDELGAYMQVDEFKQLVFADKIFQLNSKIVDGNVTTYKYEGTGGNDLYPNGNVSDIVVQVTTSDSLEQGDIVTVKIPGSLIPLRSFAVDSTDAGTTMTVKEAYPLRIFFGVSVKPEVAEAVGSGTADQALLNYIAQNTTDDGKTSFYSNFYNDSVTASGSKTLGNTTASFVPAEGNSFYYFTENTPLYTDDACQKKLMTEPQAGKTYYYKRSYYKLNDNGSVTQEPSITRFVGANFDTSRTFWGKSEDDSYYIKADAPRLTRIDDLTLTKTDNTTGTASEVINPQWDDINNPYAVNVFLGNNGKIDVELPGTLAIHKDAQVAADKNLSTDVLKDKEFTFEISIPSAKGKTLKAEVKNSQGDVTAKLFGMEFDAEGKRTQTLKDDETLYIYGLDAGVNYTVTENSLPAGFTQTSKTGDAGTIAGNKVTTASFVNTYDVNPVTVDANALAKWQKTFDRWDLAESFDIRLAADQAGNPMPEGSETGVDRRGYKDVTATDAVPSGNFGAIEFTKPGTYTYTVTEVTPAQGVAGVSYSDADYGITVTVTDDGKGNLSANSVMTKMTNDNGQALENSDQVDDNTATFVNTFNASSTTAGPRAVKRYTNNGGSNTILKDNMFTFKVKAVGGNADSAPKPDGVKPNEDGYFTVTNIGSGIAFGQATFNADHVGNTYVYEISEVIPDGATAENNWTVNGMTYDPTVYHAKFAVTSEVTEGNATVKVAVSYFKMVDGQEQPLDEGMTIPEFTNSYKAASVEVDPVVAKIQLTKTFEGREWKDTDSFTFVLAGDENNPKPAKGAQVTVTKPAEGNKVTFDFGKATFDTIGSYHYAVSEVTPEDGDKIPGVTYDTHTADIYVNVTDPGDGQLVATTEVHNTDFTNTYEAKLIHNDAGGLVVTKTTYGHAMTEGQFRFQIEALEGTGITAEDTAKRIGIKEGATGEFGNVAGDAGEKVEMTSPNPIEFTQADAGKVFKLKVSEQGADGKFGTGGTKDGYTYDGQVYTVELSVADNGDGTLTLTTKVTDKDDKVVTNETSTAANPKATHLDFVNTYEASTIDDSDVNLTATKTLNGRDMAADEFSFKVVSNPLDEAGTIVDVLTGGKNAASDNGKAANIDFGNDNQLDYKLKDLKELAADTTANKYV